MIYMSRPLIWVAAAGLAASVVVHVSCLLGLPQPFGNAAWALHVGVFVVWIPAVIVARRLSSGARPADFWKAALRGCPAWMRVALYVLGAYAFINFFAGIALKPDTETDNFRIFSGHWMLFYFAAMVILYSADRLGSLGPRTCPQGHEVSPFAKFCDQCGSQLPPTQIA